MVERGRESFNREIKRQKEMEKERWREREVKMNKDRD